MIISQEWPTADRQLLEEVIGAVYVPTVAQYKQELEEAGFVDVEFEDLTSVWTKWTCVRRDRFVQNREQQVATFQRRCAHDPPSMDSHSDRSPKLCRRSSERETAERGVGCEPGL